MTILQPSNNKRRFVLFVALLAFFVAAVLYIYEYNRSVGLRHSVNSLKKEISDGRMINADLKSQIYQLVDAARLEQLVQEQGMVLEQKPGYLSVGM